MLLELIKKNATVVWSELHNCQDGMSLKALIKKTALSREEVAAAVGWLAQAKKIYINESSEGDHFGVYQECYY